MKLDRETKIDIAYVVLLITIIGIALFIPQQTVNQKTMHELDISATAYDPIHVSVYNYYYIDGVLTYNGHNDANKTNIGLDWLVNRTTGFGNNASQTMIYIGWSNSTANAGASTTHLSWVFNNSAGQGNGLGIKTLTSANWTRWVTYGKFNLTARGYAQETIQNIRKVFISFSTSVYNAYVAIDIINPVINLPSGGTSWIESTFIITFS